VPFDCVCVLRVQCPLIVCVCCECSSLCAPTDKQICPAANEDIPGGYREPTHPLVGIPVQCVIVCMVSAW
jgi:hypothetical protein